MGRMSWPPSLYQFHQQKTDQSLVYFYHHIFYVQFYAIDRSLTAALQRLQQAYQCYQPVEDSANTQLYCQPCKSSTWLSKSGKQGHIDRFVLFDQQRFARPDQFVHFDHAIVVYIVASCTTFRHIVQTENDLISP